MKEISSSKLTYSILQLQNLIKRDPLSYYEEFLANFEHFQALLEVFNYNPQEYHENFADMVNFLSQVAYCYKEDLKEFPEQLMKILKENATVLDPSMRLCLVKGLILMRNRDVLLPTDLTTLFFELLRCKDKLLRHHLQSHIITDLKRVNAKHKNNKVNKALQNFMFKMLADSNATSARVSLNIMIELYRRNIWRDEKTVNAIATACLANDKKLVVKAHNFFLSIDYEDDDDSESENEGVTNAKEIVSAHKMNKKTRKRKKLLEKAKQVLIKSKKRLKNQENCNFAAIHLLNDPLGLAEKLYAKIQNMKEGYQVKLLVMNFISRLIGIHELILLNFYPYLTRFLRTQQTDVTKLLVCAAQATHEFVPPDAIEQVIKQILFNFVNDGNSAEAITVGINTIREICARCPLAVNSETVQDLADYDKYKDKNVTGAAHSLIRLFREINPKMLRRKHRSRPTEANKEFDENNFKYGALKAKSYIPGTEVLSIDPSTSNATDDEIEDEEDSDGSWIDFEEESCEVKNEEDENEDKSDVTDLGKSEEKDETHTNDPQTEKDKAEMISHSRILSQDEFRKIKVAQLSKQVKYARGKKRKSEVALNESDNEESEIVRLESIEKLSKRAKMNKEERKAHIMEGREGRESFSQKKKKNPLASKTQKQNNKNKAFMMIKHKVRGKIKRSFKDKQLALRKAILKQKKRY